MRPFYFVVVFWGERFRDYLGDFCLASLLSPNNIPALSGGRRNRFIFCTTPEDRAALTRTAIFAHLECYVRPEFVEIPPAPPGRSGCEHMGIGHKAAAEIVYRAGGYGVFVTPDLMMADGSVAALERHAREGRRVVLATALRFGEEPLFSRLGEMGVVPRGVRASRTGQALTIGARQLVEAGIKGFHSETLRYEWEAPYFSNFPCACWWRVPGGGGIVVHSLSWCPVLLDYAAVRTHDTSVFDTWTLDGDYVHRNFSGQKEVHIVTDSDEIMLVSWAPMSDRAQSLSPSRLKALPVVGDLVKGAILRGAVTSGVFDPLKLSIFLRPVRWHTRDLDTTWTDVERRAHRVLTRFVGDVCGGGGQEGGGARLRLLAAIGRAWVVGADLFAHRRRLAERVEQACRGDRVALARIGRRIRRVWRSVVGAKAIE